MRSLIFLLGLVLVGTLTASSQGTTTPLGAICHGHETAFGADLRQFPGLQNLQLTENERNNTLRLPFALFLGGLHALDPTALATVFARYVNVLGVADNFAPHSGTDPFGLVEYRALYIATPGDTGAVDAASFFHNAQASSGGNGVTVYAWTLQEKGHPDYHFFASVLPDGTLLLATAQPDLLQAAAALQGKRSQPCTAEINTLSRAPFWLWREARKAHPITWPGLGDPANHVTAMALTIQSTGRADWTLHGSFATPPVLRDGHGNALTFAKAGADYALQVTSASEQTIPYLWYFLLGVFGFEVAA